MIYEKPNPIIEADWDVGNPQWREITPLAYRELRHATRPLHQNKTGFMQSEPYAVLRDGEVACVCCRTAEGYCFARIMPAGEWFQPHVLPLPKIEI